MSFDVVSLSGAEAKLALLKPFTTNAVVSLLERDFIPRKDHMLYSCGANILCLKDITNANIVWTKEFEAPISSIRASPDHRYYACQMCNNRIIVGYVLTGQVFNDTIIGNLCAWSPDSILLLYREMCVITAVNVVTSEIAFTRRHSTIPNHIFWLADDMLVGITVLGTLEIYQRNGDTTWIDLPQSDVISDVCAVASPDNAYLFVLPLPGHNMYVVSFADRIITNLSTGTSDSTNAYLKDHPVGPWLKGVISNLRYGVWQHLVTSPTSHRQYIDHALSLRILSNTY